MKMTIALLSLATACSAVAAIAQDNTFAKGPIKRVLLISVDGMHAVDLQNCVNGIATVNGGDPYCPALAALTRSGVNYVSATTPKPSDSFPGLITLVTGGSPALTGVYYDVAYARNLDAPAATTGNGLAAGPCTPGTAPTVDPRTPDIIVAPNVGVTYSSSTEKLSEHGGFAHDDTNVVLLLSNPSFQPKTVNTVVGTA
jgi:hypothetical protein